MSAPGVTDPLPSAAAIVSGDVLGLPVVRGVTALRFRLVDRIKRAALRQLHASRRGERLLLRMYHDGEEASQVILREQLARTSHGTLARQIKRHLAEEQAHTALFAAALGPSARGPRKLAPAGLSRRKLARWRQLAARYAPQFAQGALVPAFATALCAEQMAVRLLGRHCEVIGSAHALHPLFFGVLADERRHVRLCAHTVRLLVAPPETDSLQGLLTEIRKIEMAGAITGALAMLAVGWVMRALPRGAAA